MADAMEELGKAIDRLDNFAHGLVLPLPDALHVKVLRDALPEVVKELKAWFVAVTGENPWEE